MHSRFPIFCTGVLVLALVALAALPAAAAPDNAERYWVEFAQLGPQSAQAIEAAGGSVVHQFPELNAIAAVLSQRAVEALGNQPGVVAIEVDPKRYPMAQTTPYGIPMVQADQVSDASASNRKVCIIDSGYYMSHEDLQDSGVTATQDSGTGDPFTDLCGHGTHVAGTVAALNNTVGVIGVLPSGTINLHIVKVFGDDCSWSYSSDLVAALDACTAAGSNVVSMSLGCTGAFCKSRFEESAFNNAYSNGVLSIAAAGNAGSTDFSYPASYDSVVSVAAIDSNKVVADFSQKNSQVELAAPGVSVLSTVPWLEDNTLTSNGITYQGNHIQYAARTTGVSGTQVDGGLCDTTGAWSGAVVLCERGSISFFDKVMNVQNSGGVAAVIYNNVSGGFIGTLGDGNSSEIPAISLSQEDGQFIVANDMGLTGTVVSQVTQPASGYEAWNGTSMATPHVSGVAALVWSHNTAWSNDQVRKALQSSAEDLGDAGRDDAYGYGLVQAKAALDLLSGGGSCTVTESPEASCSDGLDNDCDGFIDADDSDCSGGSCLPAGDSCTSNDQCCSLSCKGKPGAQTCK